MKKTPHTGWLAIIGWLVMIVAAAYPLTPARGATGYYVSPTGNDANPGTFA